MNPDDSPTKVSPLVGTQLQRHLGDIFENILFFFNLLILGSIITLILGYFIDKWFPTILTASTTASSSPLLNILGFFLNVDLTTFGIQDLELLRMYSAVLIVSLPTFILLSIHIMRRTMRAPEIKNFIIRKILIYSTLTATFLILEYSLIFCIANLLNGNITWNLGLHFLVDLLVNGSIFVCFFFQIKQDLKTNA